MTSCSANLANLAKRQKNKTVKNGVELNSGGVLVSSILYPCVLELPKALYLAQLNWFLFTLRHWTWPFNYTPCTRLLRGWTGWCALLSFSLFSSNRTDCCVIRACTLHLYCCERRERLLSPRTHYRRIMRLKLLFYRNCFASQFCVYKIVGNILHALAVISAT